jgi:hypothetical protein
MEPVLIAVTAAAVVVAILMAGLAARVLAAERRRSDSRVALLAAQAAESPVWSGHPQDDSLTADFRMETDYELRDVVPLVASSDLFSVAEQPSAWPRRIGVAAALALIALVIGVGARATGALRGPESAPAAAVESTAVRGASIMLELLSLGHTQPQPGVLTITGLVQNPRDGAPLDSVMATALLFAADGSFLASGRAPLDFTVLRPGDETAFVISVGVAAPVARYRIGFRAGDGRIIGHVDRRAAGAIARGPS